MKKFLALVVLALATTFGTADTAQAQWGYGGGRGYSISIGGRSGVTYSRGYGGRNFGGVNRNFGVINRGYGYGGFRNIGYRPVYVNRPVYGGGVYYGGRSYYGGGRRCGW